MNNSLEILKLAQFNSDIPAYSEDVVNDRLTIYTVSNAKHKNTFGQDVSDGLTSEPKYLLPKYFYDNTGSALFELICETPEYYVTRTETSILQKFSDEIARLNSGMAHIIELGSGSSVKTKYILSSFIKTRGSITYHPIDVSEILIQSSKSLLNEFEGLSVHGTIGEYEESLQVINSIIDEPKMIVFLGSSIGNFSPVDAHKLISRISGCMNENDSLLIGFDLVKHSDILNAAYDDDTGITARFNVNLLERINNELGGSFNTDKFTHKAFFNEELSRVEMHLVSTVKQEVAIKDLDLKLSFAKDETIHTENSYKFTRGMIIELASSAGLSVTNSWNDSQNYFELCLMRK